MLNRDKVVITCALNGVLTDPKTHPVPYTPEQMAEEAREAQQEGAAIAHIHLREQSHGRFPSWDAELAQRVVSAIREAAPGMLINLTTGVVGEDISGPLGILKACAPEMAAMNSGTLNYLKVKRDGSWAWPPILFDNPVEKIEKYLEVMGEEGIVPECECFDVGIARSVGMFVKNGILKGPYTVSLVQGVASGMPARSDLLPIVVDELERGTEGGQSWWQSIVIGRAEVWEVHRKTAELGGMMRTGLEDTFYLESGEKVSRNAQLIAELVRVAREAGREPASADEVRAALGLVSGRGE